VLESGLAFHHAGLDQEDRRLVESLFREGLVRVLCATSTLAQGVNLPARLVVVKSTLCYKGSAQGYEEYSRIEMEQMCGRAGRTGLDPQGIVVIMTYQDNVKRY
jgi:ATP-dependent DNA helicase HFM1/MER3